MRRRIVLYIGGMAADLADDALVLFTYTRETLDNPAAVKNSYTKKITLPGTAANNAIFGRFFRQDRVTDVGGGHGTMVGADYNALKRTPFRIYDEESRCLESGYVKLETVQESAAGIVSYTVTLFGGLGSFLYGLMYAPDGTKRSIANIYLKGYDPTVSPEMEFQVIARASALKYGWAHLKTATLGAITASTPVEEIVNFAPAYNGLPPSGFDAQRAVHKLDADECIPPQQGCGPYVSGQQVLVSYTKKYTEWQMRDLRAYLQRPVVRLRAIIDACTIPENNGGYKVELDPGFFNDGNQYYNETWITLPILPFDKRGLTNPNKTEIFGAAFSPADVLISFAKTFGLVFDVNEADKLVRIYQRADFYYGGDKPLDVTERVDTSGGITSLPYSFTKRFVRFSAKQFGEFADWYESRYNRPYGSMTVDTGLEHDDQISGSLDGAVFNGSPEVLEWSKYFCYVHADTLHVVPSALLDIGAKYKLLGSQTNEYKDFDVTPLTAAAYKTYYDQNNPLADLIPKIQLHGAEDASQDGAGVLLFYRGNFSVLSWYWSITDDTNEMLALNNGVPCWDPYAYRREPDKKLDDLPIFSRYYVVDSGVARGSLDFGTPSEVQMGGTMPAANDGIYPRFWKRYIEDRCDVDSRVVRVKMDLSGLEVGPQIFRRQIFWRNSIWVFNKIEDYSLTTYDFAKIELIKVKDFNNYRNL